MEIGKRLKEARELRGLTLNAVEDETRIRRKYIQAMENEDFAILPGPTYTRAFLRSYAKYLGLNMDDILELYNKTYAKDQKTQVVKEQAVEHKPYYGAGGRAVHGKRAWLYVVISMLLFGLTFILYINAAGLINQQKDNKILLNDEIAQIPDIDKNNDDTGEPPPDNQETDVSLHDVHLILNVVKDRCWARIDLDGQTAFQGLLYAGETKSYFADVNISVVLGNAGVVEVIHNGKNLGFLGEVGSVAREVFTASGRD